MKFSQYQENFFNWSATGTGNCFLEAVAGSGKTTTVEESVKRVPRHQRVLAIAFTRLIRDELATRLDPYLNVCVNTLNQFGFSVCRNQIKCQVKPDKTDRILKYEVIGKGNGMLPPKEWKLFCLVRRPINRLVSLIKANLLIDFPLQPKDIDQLMTTYGIDYPNIPKVQFYRMVVDTFRIGVMKTSIIDLDDQIFLPLLHGWPIPKFDWVFVDEAQDLTPAQIMLSKMAIGERSAYVGDRYQAIYQFRGADSHAVDNIITELSCTQLPLSICYRCSKAVVKEAQKIVPHIECSPNSPEGQVDTIKANVFRAWAEFGDMVICRTTAPLVSECLKFIRDGKRAAVKGREIAENLTDLVVRLSDGNSGMRIFEFNQRLQAYQAEQTARLDALENDSGKIVLADTVETIQSLASNADSVNDISNAISKVFDETVDGIVLLTAHKAKGLEAKKGKAVFIIRPDLMPHKLAKTEEAQFAEKCLKYVAITRAKESLFWVEKEEGTQ